MFKFIIYHSCNSSHGFIRISNIFTCLHIISTNGDCVSVHLPMNVLTDTTPQHEHKYCLQHRTRTVNGLHLRVLIFPPCWIWRWLLCKHSNISACTGMFSNCSCGTIPQWLSDVRHSPCTPLGFFFANKCEVDSNRRNDVSSAIYPWSLFRCRPCPMRSPSVLPSFCTNSWVCSGICGRKKKTLLYRPRVSRFIVFMNRFVFFLSNTVIFFSRPGRRRTVIVYLSRARMETFTIIRKSTELVGFQSVPDVVPVSRRTDQTEHNCKWMVFCKRTIFSPVCSVDRIAKGFRKRI